MDENKVPERYAVCKGELTGQISEDGVPVIKMEEILKKATNLGDIRLAAVREYRKGTNVIILDGWSKALIGILWTRNTEIPLSSEGTDGKG